MFCIFCCFFSSFFSCPSQSLNVQPVFLAKRIVCTVEYICVTVFKMAYRLC